MGNATFNKGELVRVVNDGKVYTTYATMFRKLGFSNTARNSDFKVGSVGQIFNIGNHPDFCYTMYAIRDVDGNECLIDEDGIERFSYKTKLPAFNFEIDKYECYVDENKFTVGCTEITKDMWKKIKAYVEKSGFGS